MIKYQKRALKYYFKIGVSLERWAFISSCTVTAQGNQGRKHPVQVSWQRKTSLHTKVCVANWTYIHINSSVKIQNRSCDQHFTHHHTKKPKTKLKLGSEKVYTPETKHCRENVTMAWFSNSKGMAAREITANQNQYSFPKQSPIFFFPLQPGQKLHTSRVSTSQAMGREKTLIGWRGQHNDHTEKVVTPKSYKIQNLSTHPPPDSLWQACYESSE